MSIASLRTWMGAIGVATVVAATPLVRADSAKQTETREVGVPHVDNAPVTVKTANGSINVKAYDGPSVRITAQLSSKSKERLRDAKVTAERNAEDHGLTVACVWPGGKPKDGDGCSFEVLLPNAHGVTADTANGSITISGFTGDLVADTSNGSITIAQHEGPIKADTSNGSITVSDASGEVSADTSNGSISVALLETNPGPVNLDTSNGSIRLEVGPAFVGSVHASTSLGHASVGTFPEGMNVEIAERGKRSFKAIFGGTNEPKSVLDTSVGNVTVQPRS